MIEPRPGGDGQLDRDNPWPGLESYDEASTEFFSGRAAEADDLRRRIVDEPMTVLFGKSGLGKTSLLKAGVFPRLRQEGLLPILLRLQVRPGTEPLIEQVRLALFGALDAQEIEHPASADGETPWEYLHRTGQELWTRQNRLVRPVFVFDQFEELFTLGRMVPAEVAVFREDLADLVENRIPAGVAHRLENRPASELGLDLQAMPYKVVVALREDFLADLEGWRPTIPSLRRNRMRLLPMGPEQALQAVCNERTNHLVAEPLAREIVAFLATGAATPEGDGSAEGGGPTVEPALLSLFCRGVNEHRKQEGKARFDEALVEGGKGTIVTDFYRTSLQDQPERVRRFVEEELITEHGFRNSYSVDDALAHGFVTAKELEALINRHLLRHEHHLGTERIELTHDLLTKAVIDERDERRRDERSERERRQRLRQRRLVGACTVVVLIFAAVAIAALYAWNEAGKERDRSRSKELAALAETELNENPERAVLLALAGLQWADTTEARTGLLAAAQYAWPSANLKAEALGGTPEAVALSSDGNRLAVLAGGRSITMWDVTSREPAQAWKAAVALEGSASLAFSPDQPLVAVGRSTSIDLLNVARGTPVRQLKPHLPTDESQDVDDRKIAFSPDGRWLAWVQGDGIRLLDYRREDAMVESVPAKAVVAFAFVPDGNRIIVGNEDPSLMAHAFDWQGNGRWASNPPLPLEKCTKPQSVSPGAQYVSATWRARACRSETSKDATEFSPREDPVKAEATWDILWSAAGNAFAEILQSRDIIVSRSDGFETQSGSRIKGTNVAKAGDLSQLISMSEAGTRVALIDRGRDPVVRIYSLADHKPFLSRFDTGPVSVAPDGCWIAVGRRPAPGEETATVDVIPLEHAFESGDCSRVRTRLAVPASPAQIMQFYAAPSSVVAVLQSEEVRAGETQQVTTTVVFDATTGKPRFGPLEGQAEVLGAARELLLIHETKPPWGRVLKTRDDGSPLAPWGELPAADGPPVFLVSPGKGALAALHAQVGNAKAANAIVYSVRGDGLVVSGQVVGLPAALLSAPYQLELADDARSITETRPDGEGPGKFVWPVTSGHEAASARPAPAIDTTVVSASPSGRFELREESKAGTDVRTFTVVSRTDGSILKKFRGVIRGHRFSSDDRWLVTWNEKRIQVLDLERGKFAWNLDPGDVDNVEFKFSSDDRWLATWNEKRIQVLDLERGEIAWDLDPDGVENVKNVYFEAGNAILNVQLYDDATTLIPLDGALMERFAKWLVPGALTPEERCQYGLESEDECR